MRVHVTYHHHPDGQGWTADSPDQPTLHGTGDTLTDCRNNVKAHLDRMCPDGYQLLETIRLGAPPQDT